jgi:hypothetical protein
VVLAGVLAGVFAGVFAVEFLTGVFDLDLETDAFFLSDFAIEALVVSLLGVLLLDFACADFYPDDIF